MSCIKDHSIVNHLMFAPPSPSYDKALGVFWIKDICCLMIHYHDKEASILSQNDEIITRPVMILCHGNACDMGHMTHFATILSKQCQCHVLLYEYPGYGLSPGKACENSCCTGISNVIDFLHLKMLIPIHNMLFYGQSIGSGIAAFGYVYCQMTYHCSPAALILISPYKSIQALAKNISPFGGSMILNRLDTFHNI